MTAASSAAPRPSVAPPSVAPRMNQVAVVRNRLPRPCSPSGVIVESIDCPHGDHVERIAAATATTPARTAISTSADYGTGSPAKQRLGCAGR